MSSQSINLLPDSKNELELTCVFWCCWWAALALGLFADTPGVIFSSAELLRVWQFDILFLSARHMGPHLIGRAVDSALPANIWGIQFIVRNFKVQPKTLNKAQKIIKNTQRTWFGLWTFFSKLALKSTPE